MKTILLLSVMGIALCGCARFTTHQTDSTGTNGVRVTTTDVAAWTLWNAKSEIAKSRVFQSDKSQSSTVGSLNQSATNELVEVLREVKGIISAMPKP